MQLQHMFTLFRVNCEQMKLLETWVNKWQTVHITHHNRHKYDLQYYTLSNVQMT